MNLVSTMVGLSIAGVASPMLMDISLAPGIAQKRAQNFGEAEAVAVTYAAANEGKPDLVGSVPDNCERTDLGDRAYEVECTKGADTKFVQTVARSFRLAIVQSCNDNDGDNGHGNSGGFDCSNPGNSGFVNNERVFEFPSPPGFSAHQCLLTNNWGLDTTAFNRTKNKWNGPSCTPNAAWNSKTYLASDPNAWMYDINGEKGFGDHPDY